MTSIEDNVQKLREIDDSIENYPTLMGDILCNHVPDSVKDKIRAMVADMFGTLAQIKTVREAQAETVKSDMLASGEKTYEGNGYKITVMPGRVSWDGKKLDGYMVAHPEITPFRKVGNPFVTIKTIKG